MKTQAKELDLVILGGGRGSTIARWTLASEGKQVAVVERKYIGGSWHLLVVGGGYVGVEMSAVSG